MEFIKLLIQHIPDKQFKMIRYYGLYARHREQDKKLFRAIPDFKHRFLLDFNKWRTLFFASLGYDPLECPKCRTTMIPLELYFKHKQVSLTELYERATAKLHCRSGDSSACFSPPSGAY